MSMAAGMEVKIFFQQTVGEDFLIELGKPYFDFITKDETKNYYMDLSKVINNVTGKTISLGFVVYAGQPSIKVSLDPNFSETLTGQ
jgi:hypothetical protein